MPDDEYLKRLYIKERLSSGKIANKVGVTRHTVCRHLRRLGIVRPEAGPESRNRNFETKQFRSGYPVTFMPNHPRANHIGYVFDHVLVMEKAIQRTPSKKEPIHHIDFNRNNSKLENLYLCKSHKDHALIHQSLEDVARELFARGLVQFKNGIYALNPHLTPIKEVDC
jgi:hypothetical protein